MRLNAIDNKNNSQILAATLAACVVALHRHCSHPLHGIRLPSEQNMILYIIEYLRLGNHYFRFDKRLHLSQSVNKAMRSTGWGPRLIRVPLMTEITSHSGATNYLPLFLYVWLCAQISVLIHNPIVVFSFLLLMLLLFVLFILCGNTTTRLRRE